MKNLHKFQIDIKIREITRGNGNTRNSYVFVDRSSYMLFLGILYFYRR